MVVRRGVRTNIGFGIEWACAHISSYSNNSRMMVYQRFFRKIMNDLFNYSFTPLFVEQPRLHQICKRRKNICVTLI